MVKKPEQKDALVIFAHPGFHFYRKPFEFSHFKFDKDIADKIISIETHHLDPITFLGPGYDGKMFFIDEAVQSGFGENLFIIFQHRSQLIIIV